MRRITTWALGTLTALVLLFSYHTSTSSSAAGVVAVGGVGGVNDPSGTGSASGGGAAGSGGTSAATPRPTPTPTQGTGSSSGGTSGSSSGGASGSSSGDGTYTGDAVMNERLGLARAEAVKRYLYEHHQIPLHKINVISYGEEKPVAPNNTRVGRAQNRRVVIKVLA